jgi:hypothetical protein
VAGRPSVAFGLSMVCDCELCALLEVRFVAAGAGGKDPILIFHWRPHATPSLTSRGGSMAGGTVLFEQLCEPLYGSI